MKNLKKHILLFVTIALFSTGFIAEYFIFHQNQASIITEKFERKLHKQQVLLDQKLEQIYDTIQSENFEGNFQAAFRQLSSLFNEKGLGFLIVDGQRLLFWSDNRFSFRGEYLKELLENKIQFLPNGIYTSTVKKAGNLTVIGLIHIKDNYSIRNEFISNKFARAFDTPESYIIRVEASPNGLPVHSIDGEYLFSLIPREKIYYRQTQLYVTSFLFALGIITLLLYVWSMLKHYKGGHFYGRMLILALSLFCFYLFHLCLRIPGVFYAYELWGPSLYAGSMLIPSLGHLLLFSILIFFWSISFAREFSFGATGRHFEFPLAFAGLSLFYLSVNFLIENLVHNSSFSLYLNNIADINFYSIIAFFIIALFFFSAAAINMKIVEAAAKFHSRKQLLYFFAPFSLILIVFSIIWNCSYIYVVCLFALTSLSMILFQKTQLERSYFSYIVYFVSLFSFFSLITIQNHNNTRRQEIQKLRAVSLYSEHDPAAEVFLTEMQRQINTDSVIPRLLLPPYNQLEQYIDNKYFNSYFRKYDIQITVCDGSDSLLIQPDNRLVPCFPFFDDMIRDSGIRIPRTNFYFMNNMNGRISYFGKLFYPLSSDSLGVSIFLELQSKLVPEGTGFPELLLDKSMKTQGLYKPFSYGKYYNNELVQLSGDYQYSFYFNTYDTDNDSTEFTYAKRDGYDHLIYNPGKENYIIVSAPSFDFLDYLVAFPYVFVFYFILAFFMFIAGSARYRKSTFTYDLKFRIQASIIAVVLFSLLLVAAGTIYYNIKESNNRYKKDLNEKMRSIAQEVNLRLIDVSGFTPEIKHWLLNYLSDLSNIFRTDISIYGTDGELIVTSRPEIITRGLVSSRMNAKAFYELTENYQNSYIQPEKIGNLAFLSIYEPIINNEGEYLGFINLPYFTRGNELRQEISTFIVAFINLYVLLFLASMVMAVLLANRITLPLSLIREKLKGIQLNKRSEQINYKKNDEIGDLIQEYNRKVEELADSAELLARSERESAWREMAKQVAHEIKNPLTPMKLNIQYLQKAKEENNPHYDEYFNKVTGMLIEQIDALSGIATEFSDFAKIPGARNEVFDLAERLKHTISLFDSNRHMQFILDLPQNKGTTVYADKEQISRAVINLIKNAMQSIPLTRKGKISVRLSKSEEHALIAVSDNGKGIPEEYRQFMFQPNFTTKTSGMGLGLAIVMKIVETCHGRVWYESEVDNGTTFYIELPLYR